MEIKTEKQTRSADRKSLISELAHCRLPRGFGPIPHLVFEIFQSVDWYQTEFVWSSISRRKILREFIRNDIAEKHLPHGESQRSLKSGGRRYEQFISLGIRTKLQDILSLV